MVYDSILPSYGLYAIKCHPGGWNLDGELKIHPLAAPLNKVPLGLPFGSNVRTDGQTENGGPIMTPPRADLAA